MYRHPSMGCSPGYYPAIAGMTPFPMAVRMGADAATPSLMDRVSANLESSSLAQHLSPTSTIKNKWVYAGLGVAGVAAAYHFRWI